MGLLPCVPWKRQLCFKVRYLWVEKKKLKSTREPIFFQESGICFLNKHLGLQNNKSKCFRSQQCCCGVWAIIPEHGSSWRYHRSLEKCSKESSLQWSGQEKVTLVVSGYMGSLLSTVHSGCLLSVLPQGEGSFDSSAFTALQVSAFFQFYSQ